MATATLGTVASGIGIASLVIQLNDSVAKAVNFCESVKDRPESLSRIAEELRMLNDIICLIQQQDSSGHVDDVSRQLVLSLVKSEVEKLAKLVTDLSQCLQSAQGPVKMSWARLRIANSNSTISRIRVMWILPSPF